MWCLVMKLMWRVSLILLLMASYSSASRSPTPTFIAGAALEGAERRSLFGSSVGGWTPQGNATVAHSRTGGVDSGGALQVTVDRSGPWPDGTRTARVGSPPKPGEGVPVTPGEHYYASWQIRPASTTSPVRCELRWYRQDGKILSTSFGPFVTQQAGTWTMAACDATAPSGAAYAGVRVYIDQADYGDVHYVDNASLATSASTNSDPAPAPAPEPTQEPAPAPEPTQEPAPAPEPTPSPEPEGPSPPAPSEIAHGEQVNGSNTGPTAYYAADLGRTLRYTDLKPSGTVTTTRDGQVIERLDINGAIVIAHRDVTVRAVRIRSGAKYSISYASGSPATNARIEYVEIDGRTNTDGLGVYLRDFTMRHSHIYGHRVGGQFGSNSIIEYNYVHSQNVTSGSHNTAMSIHGGSNATVRYNNFVGSTSSALSLYPRVAPLKNILVEGNLFNGGSYCTYAGNTSNHPYRAENEYIRYHGNKFGRLLHSQCGRYGPYFAYDSTRPGNSWTNNTWQDTGGQTPRPTANSR